MARHPERRRKPHKPRPPKPPPVSPPPPVTGNAERETFLRCLRSKLGSRYVYATAGPHTFDCSGLVDFCYRGATGRTIPGGRGSWLQCHQAGRALPPHEPLKPGDLLCFLDGQHVGIYEGDNLMVNALNEDEGVRENDIMTPYWRSHFDGARRLWED